MPKKLIIILLALTPALLHARELSSAYISSGFHYGSVLATDTFIDGSNSIKGYTTETLKYTMRLNDDMWQKQEYGDPYYGAGIGLYQFGRNEDLGNPVALYLLQGARITPISKRIDLNYELNLGISMGWEPYNSSSNPENVVIGSKTTINVGVNLYLNWYLSKYLDLNLGASLFHASNGSFQQPNKGINAANIYAELSYNFNRESHHFTPSEIIEMPPFRAHFEHSLEMIISTKNIKGVGYDDSSNSYNTERFPIFGASYKFMRAPNHKFRYGVGCELLYDESAGAVVYEEYAEDGSTLIDITQHAPIEDRLSAGISLDGELIKPYFTTFANLGYIAYEGVDSEMKFYQTIGVKFKIYDEIYTTFGVRAKNFGKAMFLYFSTGYTFGSKQH